MTVQVKITPQGGYVVGDGPCPFNPDDFFIMFGERIMDAQRQQLAQVDITIPDEEMDALKNKFRCKVAETPANTVEFDTAEQLLVGAGL